MSDCSPGSHARWSPPRHHALGGRRRARRRRGADDARRPQDRRRRVHGGDGHRAGPDARRRAPTSSRPRPTSWSPAHPSPTSCGTPDPYWDPTTRQVQRRQDVWTHTRGEGQIVAVLDSRRRRHATPISPERSCPGPTRSAVRAPTGTGREWRGSSRPAPRTGSAAPAWHPRRRSCRSGSATTPGARRRRSPAGILWAADHGADVINMSLAGCRLLRRDRGGDPLRPRQEHLVVASTGNDGLNGNPVMYPAANSGVIAVSATTPTARPSDWAVHGWQADIATVGESVLLTMPGAAYAPARARRSPVRPSPARSRCCARATRASRSSGAGGAAGLRRQQRLEPGVGRRAAARAVALAAADRADGGVTVAPARRVPSVSWADRARARRATRCGSTASRRAVVSGTSRR